MLNLNYDKMVKLQSALAQLELLNEKRYQDVVFVLSSAIANSTKEYERSIFILMLQIAAASWIGDDAVSEARSLIDKKAQEIEMEGV